MCTFLLGDQWLDYFDLVISGARKPGFLLDPYLPLFQVLYTLWSMAVGEREGQPMCLCDTEPPPSQRRFAF